MIAEGKKNARGQNAVRQTITHTVRFTLADMQSIRLAVALAVEKITDPESKFRQEWQRLLPEIDIKIEKLDEYERRYGHGR